LVPPAKTAALKPKPPDDVRPPIKKTSEMSVEETVHRLDLIITFLDSIRDVPGKPNMKYVPKKPFET